MEEQDVRWVKETWPELTYFEFFERNGLDFIFPS